LRFILWIYICYKIFSYIDRFRIELETKWLETKYVWLMSLHASWLVFIPSICVYTDFSKHTKISSISNKEQIKMLFALHENLNWNLQLYMMQLGGPSWKVKLGRRDSKTASRADADSGNIPGPSFSLSQLIQNFDNQGLNEKDLVALSGAHTIGFSRCFLFRDRVYNDNNINAYFAKQLQNVCPREGGDSNLAPLDSVTSAKFDVAYYAQLIKKKGLLHSDQELLNGGYTGALVRKYRRDTRTFYKDFAKSMIKMGNIKTLTGRQGEVRYNCRRAN